MKSSRYVYALVDFHGTPFYFGKGQGRRMYEHRSLAARGKHYNKHLENKIRKLGDYHEYILRDGLTDQEALDLEKYMIASVGMKNLCNYTEGGEGMSGHIPSLETRKKRSKSLMGHGVSKEAREKLAASRTGSKASVVTREKMSKSHMGQPAPNKGIPCGHVDKICGSKNVNAKTNEKDVWEIRYGRLKGMTNREISNELGISMTVVSNIKKGRAWKHVKEN